MKIWNLARALSITILVGAGCGSSDRPDPKAAPAATNAPAANNSPKAAQPKLQTLKLFLGNEEMVAELAMNSKEIETGMMHRTAMAENEGMLFVFADAGPRAFWMRNTLLPLSCAYIDPEGVIVELHDMKPLDETSIPSKSNRIQYVLEVKQGWFERHKIKPGVAIATERGTFAQTFVRR